MDIFTFIIIYIFLEYIEVSWQKAPTLMMMLKRMYPYYKKSIFLFLLMHPTFFYSSAFLIYSDYNFSSLMFFSLKLSDIAFKLILIEKVFIKKNLSQDLTLILLSPIDSFLPYMGMIIYPIFIYFALN
jgi:hypothetical protein